MILVNTLEIAGYRIDQHLGLVSGNVVQSKHIGRDIMATLKNLIGGELVGYSEMLSEAREIATSRLVAEAEALGADAVINIRYSTSMIGQGMSELLAYGTAVSLTVITT